MLFGENECKVMFSSTLYDNAKKNLHMIASRKPCENYHFTLMIPLCIQNGTTNNCAPSPITFFFFSRNNPVAKNLLWLLFFVFIVSGKKKFTASATISSG